MRHSLARSILFVLFSAFIAAANDVRDDELGSCDDDSPDMKVFYFEPFNQPKSEVVMWESVHPTDIIGVAIANRGLVTFRLDKSLFPEMSTSTPDVMGLHPTFIKESPAFKKKFTQPLESWLAGVHATGEEDPTKNIGPFQKAFIISRQRRGGGQPIGSQPFVTAIAWQMKDETRLGNIQWAATSSIDQNIILQRTEISSGGAFKIKRVRSQRETKKKGGIFAAGVVAYGTFKGVNGIIGSENIEFQNYPLTTPDAFDQHDAIDTLTYNQQVYLDSPAKLIPDDADLNKPHAATLSFEGSQDQNVWNDGNIKTVQLTIMVITSECAWILMVPAEALSTYMLPNNARLLQEKDWFKEKIKAPLLKYWKDAIESGKVTGVLLGISAAATNMRATVLTEAILREMWAMESDVPGPLQPVGEVQKIPIFSSVITDLYTAGDDSILSPINYFVCEKTYKEGFQYPERVKGLPGTFLRCALGRVVVLYAAILESTQREKESYVSPLTAESPKILTFTP
ncbi:hypothetical protein N7492_008815 [Penicillium capsulatum]|uniref:Uncharacterized protein n=1 Tax=Penicillium capsulatum TaxID=69766 RepID=A0A9W9LHG6_9EURO|nr:hypothetical protein N7492_008815 [Penicillium capsulatum]KAJ6106216.1 hypothetical protein N7512_009733 [Penicillium capsulatum]